MLIYSSASSSIITNDDKIIECGISRWMRSEVIVGRMEHAKKTKDYVNNAGIITIILILYCPNIILFASAIRIDAEP